MFPDNMPQLVGALQSALLCDGAYVGLLQPVEEDAALPGRRPAQVISGDDEDVGREYPDACEALEARELQL